MLKLKNVIYTLFFSIVLIIIVTTLTFEKNFFNKLSSNSKRGEGDLFLSFIIYSSSFYFVFTIISFIEIKKINKKLLSVNFFIFLIAISFSLFLTIFSLDIYNSKNETWWNNEATENKEKWLKAFFFIRWIFFILLSFFTLSFIANVLIQTNLDVGKPEYFINKNSWYFIKKRISYNIVEDQYLILKQKDFVFCVYFLDGLKEIITLQFNDEKQVLQEEKKVKELFLEDNLNILEEKIEEKEEEKNKVFKTVKINEDELVKKFKAIEKEFSIEKSKYFNIILFNDVNNFKILGKKDINLIIHSIEKFKFWNKKIIKEEVEVE